MRSKDKIKDSQNFIFYDEKASVLIRLYYALFKPKVYSAPKGVSSFMFGSWDRAHCCDKQFFLCPMLSGRTAVVYCYEVETPRDPGDQHFLRYKFVRYAENPELLTQ